jgi:mono/diheme cytochrome c family protein
MKSRIPRSFLRQLPYLAFVGLASCQMIGTEGHSQKADAEKGRAIFQELCAVCHGISGKGDGYANFTPPPADLSAPATRGKSDGELAGSIRDGHANTPMGAWKYALSNEEIRAVIVYIRTLGGTL